MNDKEILNVKDLSKKHCLTLRNSMIYGLKDIACEMFAISCKSHKLRRDEFWAIDNISFSVNAGESVGIIGPNGAGKSTLLKMLNGIILPDIGRIKLSGDVGALIEVGAGFHPLLTGRENIYVSGAILGLNKKQIDKKFDEIVSFSELEDFIDVPVKKYSTGMYVRLGFSIAIHSRPEILLVDEVLAVGDIGFQRKCMSKMQEFVKEGGALVLVTHDMTAVNSLCNKCIVIESGKCIFNGDTSNAIEVYFESLSNEVFKKGSEYSVAINESRYGSKSAELLSLELSSTDNVQESSDSNILITGKSSSAKLRIKVNEDSMKIDVGFSIWDQSGLMILTMNTTYLNDDSNRQVTKGDIIEYVFDFDCPLNVGRYIIGAGIYDHNKGEYADRRLNWHVLNIISNKESAGLIDIPYHVNKSTFKSCVES